MGQPLSFRTRKVLALLVYLIVEGGMHRRESLMALLWPETSAQKASIALRVTLSRLRQALQPVGEVLVTEGSKIGFDFSCPVDLDLAWLDTAIRSETLPGNLDLIQLIDRGEFLAGFSLADAPDFDTWAVIQREASQQQVEMVYDRLTKHLLSTHKISSAVETTARWVKRAPLNETAYRRLMIAQALAGDRSAALRTFAQCRAILQTELGMGPGRETTALADQIAADKVQLELDRIDEKKPSHSLPAHLTKAELLPLEGREDEHSQLAAAFRQVRQEGPQVVVLIGAAGVGKTRLLSTFREFAVLDSPGVEIWDGRAFEMGGRLPFQPVIETLRLRLEQENAPEDVLEDVWLAELSQLMPELRARYPDLPMPMTGDASFVRSRLFSAVATLGSALASRHPVVFILDDMQWADVDTREMVHYLASRWTEGLAPILLLVAVRQESFAADAQLREWLAQLDRDVQLTRLLIDRLNGTAVRQLVSRLAAPDADAESTRQFGDWLWAETQGLPFFIEALLQMLVADGVLAVRMTGDHQGYDFESAMVQVKSGGQIQVPPGVRDAIHSRVDRLSENEGNILLAAAVLGREFNFERLCKVAGTTELDALKAVEKLINGRLLVEDHNARQPYTLAHDYIREVVYSASHEARRRVFHRRALIALEDDRAPAAECAYHALAAMLDEPAFRFSLVAGDEALRANAFQESLVHYNQAREIAQRTGAGNSTLASHSLLQLYQNRGRTLELTLQYEAALANYQEFYNMAIERDDAKLKLAAILSQCVIHATYNSVYDPQKARELGEAALELSVQVEDKEAQARALWCLMLVEFHTSGDSQQVLAYGEKALVMARELRLKELEGYVLGNLSWAYTHLLRLDEARQANSEALEIWRTLGNLPMVADTYSINMGNLKLAGRHEELLAAGSETIDLSQMLGNALHQYMALLMVGEAHYLQGRLGQALSCYEKAVEVSTVSGDDRLLWGHYLYQIPVYLMGGVLEQAEQAADQLYAVRDDPRSIFRNYLLAIIAWTKISLGKVNEAEAVLAQAISNFGPDVAFSFSDVPLFVADGHLQLALGNLEGALERTGNVIRHLNQAGGQFYLADLLWLQAKAWLALENEDQARAALLQAKAVAEASGECVILWQILASLSDLESVRGDQTKAKNLRDQAKKFIHYIAENAGSESLRESFLARPAVKQVLSAS